MRDALQNLQPVFNQRLDDYKTRDAYEDWLKTHGKTADQVMIAPFDGRYGKAWLVFDRQGKYMSYFLPSANRKKD